MTDNKYFMAHQKKPIAEWPNGVATLDNLPYCTGQDVALLLADSQPLFNGPLTGLLKQWVKAASEQACQTVQGVYCGAANGDEPAYYEIAAAFFQRVGVQKAKHWGMGMQSALPAEDTPSIVILAGGSVELGSRVVMAQPWQSWLQQPAAAGRIVLGISAGAIHLTAGLDEGGQLWRGYQRHSLTLCVHEERSGWPSLGRMQEQGISSVLCLPFGAGVCICQHQLIRVCGEPFMVDIASKR